MACEQQAFFSWRYHQTVESRWDSRLNAMGLCVKLVGDSVQLLVFEESDTMVTKYRNVWEGFSVKLPISTSSQSMMNLSTSPFFLFEDWKNRIGGHSTTMLVHVAEQKGTLNVQLCRQSYVTLAPGSDTSWWVLITLICICLGYLICDEASLFTETET